MSNIKRSISEDFTALVGDEVEPETANDVPKYVSLLACIGSDLNELNDELISPDMAEQMLKYASTLVGLADKAEKPF